MNKDRERFVNCIQRMWTAFITVASPVADEEEIRNFIEAKDEAHGLLARITREESDLCTRPLSECGECGEC